MATSKNLIRIASVFLLLLSQMVIISCHKKSVPAAAEEKTEVAVEATAQAVYALVVDYSELDGCTYLLELSDGQKLQPVNLQEDFKRKGLKLFITYKMHDGVSNCMAGRMVTLTSASIAKQEKTR